MADTLTDPPTDRRRVAPERRRRHLREAQPRAARRGRRGVPELAREDVTRRSRPPRTPPEWARTPIAPRGGADRGRRADRGAVEEIAQDMTREMGKPLREARWRRRAAQILRYSAGEAFRPVGELFQQAVTGGRSTPCTGPSAWSA